VKLKLEMEWNRADTSPGAPEDEDDMMYGMNVDPSNSAEDATPKVESASAPDTSSMRSDSITPLAVCVFCRGTIVNWDILEESSRLVPTDYESLSNTSLTTKRSDHTKISPGRAIPEQ
jgi:hypothetical protein